MKRKRFRYKGAEQLFRAHLLSRYRLLLASMFLIIAATGCLTTGAKVYDAAVAEDWEEIKRLHEEEEVYLNFKTSRDVPQKTVLEVIIAKEQDT